MNDSELPPFNPPPQQEAADLVHAVNADSFEAAAPPSIAVNAPVEPGGFPSASAIDLPVNTEAQGEHVGVWARVGREIVPGLQTLV